MKKIILSLLLFGLLSRCVYETLYPTWGFVKAERNGELWEATIGAGLDNSQQLIYLRMIKYNAQGFERESLSLNRLPKQSGSYPIEITDADSLKPTTKIGIFYATSIDDGDVLGDIYELDTSVGDNFVQIDTYDEKNKEIRGSFQLSLKFCPCDRKQKYSDLPERFTLINGRFHTKILKFAN